MLSNDDRKFAIEDARSHLTAQLDLIKFHDQKAMTLLSLYVTLGIAAVGLSLSTFSEQPLIGTSAAIGLGGSAWSLFVGAMFCFRTIERVEIDLPGRSFAFWEAAMRLDGDALGKATANYLIEGVAQCREMAQLNTKLAGRLHEAKRAGIATPAVAAILGSATEVYLRLIAS